MRSALVRTTLTLDEDLAERLRAIAIEEGRSFMEVTNEVIRRGMGSGTPEIQDVRPFQI